MGEIIKFRTSADIPPRAHKYAARTVRLLNYYEELAAATRAEAVRFNVTEQTPPEWIPQSVRDKFRKADKCLRLAHVCMDLAEDLATRAGVPKKFWHSKGQINSAPRMRA
jgi:hypothetical protein